jgi:beta-glucanase (GH16 family)
MMKLALRGLFLAAATCSLASCGGGGGSPATPAPAPSTLPAGGVPTGWTLAWSDEFDVDGLPQSTNWDYDTYQNQAGWFNHELQYYAANRLENARVEGGHLIITARKEKLSTAPDYGGQNYTSARLVTRGKASWTYGFFEVRARLPCGMGTWPAIWMLGTGGMWPDDGEIDIMEQTGTQPGKILGTAHMRDFFGGNGKGSSTRVADTCGTFHNYQVHWTADAITWGVDDKNYYQYARPASASKGSWPFDAPQYLLLNFAVGGDLGGTPDDSIFPATMEIDYVRVYKP